MKKKSNEIRTIAVENFLMSMGSNTAINLMNLELDARLYKWNAATVEAIRQGIMRGGK